MSIEQEATHEGVSQNELEPIEVELPEEADLSPREQSIQDLVAANADSKEPDTLSVPDMGEPPLEAAKKETITLRIDGVDEERTWDEVVAIAQKQGAADSRLARASTRAIEQDAREEALLRRKVELDNYHTQLQRQEDAQQTSQLSSQDVGNDDSLEATKEFLENVYDGNTDDAAQKLANLIGRQKPTQNIDVQALTQQITAETVAKIESDTANKAYRGSIDEGVRWMSDTHPEIVQDRILYNAVNAETDVISKADPSLSPLEVIQRATESVSSRIGGQPLAEATQSSRADNKASLQREPTRQAGRRYRTPTVQEVDNSPAAVLDRMKQNRAAMAGR